jgi:hypothetical protein
MKRSVDFFFENDEYYTSALLLRFISPFQRCVSKHIRHRSSAFLSHSLYADIHSYFRSHQSFGEPMLERGFGGTQIFRTMVNFPVFSNTMDLLGWPDSHDDDCSALVDVPISDSSICWKEHQAYFSGRHEVYLRVVLFLTGIVVWTILLHLLQQDMSSHILCAASIVLHHLVSNAVVQRSH